MKSNLMIVILASFAAASAHASIYCHSTAQKNSMFFSDWMETTSFTVQSLDAKQLVIQAKDTQLVGKFSKIAKSGSLIYSCDAITDIADQTDIGNIFVEKSLLQGKTGQITFSVRQVGDSEGSTWINESFNCVTK